MLIGHVVAAKTNDLTASDKSMDYPKDWDSPNPSKSDLGHQEAGRTIVLHSVAILPQFQGRGLGRVLLMAYVQQMNGAGIADRLALIAHDVSAFSATLIFCFFSFLLLFCTVSTLLMLFPTPRHVAMLIVCSIRWVGMNGWDFRIKVLVRRSLEVVVGMIW